MPQQLTPNRVQSQEPPELVLRGPFTGVQSELPADEIEQIGFLDCINLILRKGAATTRPGLGALGSLASAPLGLAEFYDATAVHHYTALAQKLAYYWNGTGFMALTGALTGSATQLFSWTSVASKLLFSQGVDKVQVWDGSSASIAAVSVNAFPAFFLHSLDNRLVVGWTVEGVNGYPNRVRYTNSGDPTDWTGVSSGIYDLRTDLGPIAGFATVFQQGYVFHAEGMEQMIVTGNGLNPFAFYPFGSKGKGNWFPYSLAAYGDEGVAYGGQENIFFFNGTESDPIGSRNIQGRQIGARTAIMADLAASEGSQVFGFISTNLLGNDFKAYWLVIPTGVVWVYNFDEISWTRFTFAEAPTVIGRFSGVSVPEIYQLIGTIAQQSWSPDSLTKNVPFESVALGFSDNSIAQMLFGTYSEIPWSITSGKIVCGDRRHDKTIQRFRLVYKDIGAVTFAITVTSDINQAGQTQTVTLGTGSGDTMVAIIPFRISGWSLQYVISGAANAAASFVEFTPIYTTGGETKANATVSSVVA